MCGIFAYIGHEKAALECIKGLKKLEYRGYDSAGMAGFHEGALRFVKAAGKLHRLEEKLAESAHNFSSAISHTRWATHGKPTENNAHPHFDEQQHVAVVHNGIIENHVALRHEMVQQGINFSSETDTEVIAQLMGLSPAGHIVEKVSYVLGRLRGSMAVALLHKDYPDTLIAFSRECPLIVALDPITGQAMIASDSNALPSMDLDITYLGQDEIALIKKGEVLFFDKAGKPLHKKQERLGHDMHLVSKQGFDHFMLKEIFEQPDTIRAAFMGRLNEESATVEFEGLNLTPADFLNVKRVLILGCGTSYHAGCIAARLLEEYARVPAQPAIASEFRYQNPIISPDTLVIAISQSGETADTVAAVREAKAKGATILAICNIKGSLLTREADSTIYLKAGPEISVCSTKAFTSQLTVLALFGLYMARLRHVGRDEGKRFIQELYQLPQLVMSVLEKAPLLQELAVKYSRYNHFFYLGRQAMFYTALEGALKLKELSYIEASGYPAGEMKHGPIALLDEDLPVIAFACNRQTQDKLLSNLQECKARGAPLIVFAFEGDTDSTSLATDIFHIPSTSDALAAIPVSVASQLFAYYTALARGTDIDQPRNLAKSVTVE
ncbi:MAG: glutamine--fructose-6-phosphate transaminase (isomerizing) [Chlamydiota bacterium]